MDARDSALDPKFVGIGREERFCTILWIGVLSTASMLINAARQKIEGPRGRSTLL